RGGHLAGRQVPEDPKPIYRQAIVRLFEDLSQSDTDNPAREALVRVLVHLDGNAQSLQNLLVDMLAIRDQWSRSIGTRSADIEALLQDRQQQELNRFYEALGTQSLQQAMDIVTSLGRHMDDQQCIPAQCALTLDGADGSVEMELELAHRFCGLLVTAAGNPRAPGGINKGLFKSTPAEYAAELTDGVSELKAIYSAWQENEAARGAIERLASTPPLDLSGPEGKARNKQLRADIREILKHALAQLRVLFAEQGSADFQFITEAALLSLGESECPGEVLLSQDQRLEHILMDEFQDTSNTQFELLTRLVSGWEAGGGNSLFLVGDPMQSIYRFREANVGLFIDVTQRLCVGDVPLDYLQLQSNFRSNVEIIDWANQHFQRIFPAQDQRDSGAVSYAPASAEKGAGGQVAVFPLAPESDDADEAELALRLIQASRQQLGDPTIAVLVRARSHLTALARALLQAGIPFEAIKVNPLTHRPVISDLLAITRALSHPADRIAWLALLRAPWCGLTARQLHLLAGQNEQDDLFERIQVALQDAQSELSRHEPLQRLFQVMQCALKQSGSQSLRARVEFAWINLGGMYCYASKAELENARAFLGLLDELEKESSENLVERLMERLKDLYAASNPSKIQLMTIHQAKGLEFDVVIMPGLHKSTRKSDRPLVSLQDFRTGEGQDSALLAALPGRGEDLPSVYAYLDAVGKERTQFESQRMLYVAATRARQQLHLLGRYRVSSKNAEPYMPAGTFMEMLGPAFLDQIDPGMEEAQGKEKAGAEQAAAPTALPMLRLTNAPMASVAETAEIDGETTELNDLPALEAAALGDAVHLWLELIHDHWERGWTPEWFTNNTEALESCLRRAGIHETRIPALLPKFLETLTRTISSSPGRETVCPEGKAASWAELALFKREGHKISRHIIDRIYENNKGEFVIVDYKSGEDQPESRLLWQEQLSRYRALVEALGLGGVLATEIYQIMDTEILTFNS
ncbi:MAG TPA: 3'-5' exonuclease, partial [Xanthomonadales bacterium]|nr:3'-5' exonuclease [Xanthomonadales bacterium]